jgi:formate--tetrahydrofolate ligase
MAVLLKDALAPNLVQTLEGNPAFIHGGPFANIAHGCNSLVATKSALKMADYVVTEAGFGADLGAEKFFDIKCRTGGLHPDAAVIVATVPALRWQGGAAKDELGAPDVAKVRKGLANLARHIQNVKKFGVPVVVAINRFTSDTEEELQAIERHCAAQGVKAIRSSHWAEGGKGAEALAQETARMADAGVSQFAPLYCSGMPLWEKARAIATEIYGADDIIADKKVRDRFRQFEELGFGHLPVCMAKTQYSFSTDPALRGAPTGHVVPIREIRLAAGARFVVIICGAIMTMPGLPRKPAAENIRLDEKGEIQGLF